MEFRDLNFAHAKLNESINLLEIFTPPNEDGVGQVTPPQYIRIHGHGWLRELANLLAPYATPTETNAPAAS